MRKRLPAVLGLALTFAAAGFAAQAVRYTPAPAANSTSNTTPVAKKHVKKNKKSATNTPAATTAAPAATPAK